MNPTSPSNSHPALPSSDTYTARKNLPLVEKVCALLNERMTYLTAQPTGIEFNLNSDGERDRWSELQIIKFVVREEYQALATPQQMFNGIFEADREGIADHAAEKSTGEAIWWDDLVIFHDVKDTDPAIDWVMAVDPHKADALIGHICTRPIVSGVERQREFDDFEAV